MEFDNSVSKLIQAEVECKPTEPLKVKLVVRLITNNYINSSGDMVFTKRLKVLKRKSEYHNEHQIYHDVDAVGMMEALDGIDVDFNKLEDGVYELLTSFDKDWETGYIEDWYHYLRKIEDEEH